MKITNYFTDGACSNNGNYKAKAAYSVVIADENYNIINSMSGKVHGEQTNNRAELMAIFKALAWINNVEDSDIINIYSDSEITVRGLKGEYSRKSNLDIWNDIENEVEQIKRKGIKLKVHFIRAHTSSDDVLSKINKIADKNAVTESKKIL